ncbi:MAG: hypothetical protein Q8L85_07750 [Alphaproteobacteria bacterium]|nr:hypothetical protein [Alphaproteobacteria bacterium]MDP3531989.1 hypothetical protein [Alphaproteobacteria bacterium]
MKKFSMIAFAFAITVFTIKAYAEEIPAEVPMTEETFSEDFGGDWGGDPISNVKTNIDLTLKNYGNSLTNATIENIDSSTVDVGAAGNTVLLEGTVENFSMAAESYGDNTALGIVSGVTASSVGVISAGNAVTLR